MMRRSGGGDGCPGGVPGVARPDVARRGGVEVGAGTVLAAGLVVELAEPVAPDDDVGGGVAQGVPAVDGVAPAGQEVVLDGLVGYRHAGASGVQVDGVGLPLAVEDRIVLDGQRLGAAVDVEAVGVISGDVAGVVNVISFHQPGRYLDGGLEVKDVVVLDDHPGR